MKKTSIIVPVFNGEKHLELCIQSILSQSYSNLELILVDDGSTDRLRSICEEFSKDDSRISVIHKGNGGVSSARNEGLNHISGAYVIFIDADDYLDTDMVEFLVDLLEKNHADISQCGYRRIVGDSVRLVNNTHKTYVMNKEDALGYLITGKLFASGLWNKLFRAEILKDLRFDTEITINEDVLFSFYAFQKAGTIVFSDYLKYNYVAHLGESAIFTTAKEKKIINACAVNKAIYDAVSDMPSLREKAANRYLSSLFSMFRYSLEKQGSKKELVRLKYIIKNISLLNRNINRKMKLSCFLIRYCPLSYRIMYTFYDRIRKHNWDVEVDE